jgi:hypothetical protein
MRQVSFQPACIGVSVEQRSRCTLNGRSVEDYQAMRENPAPLSYLQQALAIAKFDPGMYEVVDTYSRTASEF